MNLASDTCSLHRAHLGYVSTTLNGAASYPGLVEAPKYT